jgi:ATP-dependent protease Clp ATPase subunit
MFQSIGFNAVLAEKATDDDEVTAEKVDEGDTHKKKDLLSGLTSHDLVEYGFIPE